MNSIKTLVIALTALGSAATTVTPSTLTAAAVPMDGSAYQAMPALVSVATVPNDAPGADVREAVESYFSDIPVMIDVARCESGFRQTNAKGQVVRGVINRYDVGVMQINEYYNGSTAKKLGYDLMTLNGNMSFARHLYEVYGTSPWSASERCWSDPNKSVSGASQVAVR